MDTDGYPDEDELTKIKNWPADDLRGLFAFMQERWAYPTYFTVAGDTYDISTAGWSGNEDLIGALQENLAAWFLSWQSSRRGGHYVFKIPEYQAKT